MDKFANVAVRILAMYVLVGVIVALMLGIILCAPLALAEFVAKKLKRFSGA